MSPKKRCITPVEIPENQQIDSELAQLAKALAQPARVHIIRILATDKVCIGSDLVEDLRLAQSTVSEHLRILTQTGLVYRQKDPPHVCYTLNQTMLQQLRDYLENLMPHVFKEHSHA